MVQEITRLQAEIRERGKQIYELAGRLRLQVRRSQTDDNTAVYLTYTNALTRYAGAVEQVSSRTERSARILKLIKEEANTEAEQEQKPEVKAPKPRFDASSPMESLISSYIEESSEMSGGNR